MIIEVRKQIEVPSSYAVQRARSLYNVTDGQDLKFEFDAEIPIEEEGWRIGVVVGPSGSGKTSIGRELSGLGWSEWKPVWGEGPVLEEVGGDFAKATGTMSAVGLGSVPSWLRPYGVLSNGERYRADLARLLLQAGGEDEGTEGYWIDEFTSVLDRRVAKVGAGAFAKAWKRGPGRAGAKVVLLTPHSDILEWLQPDWVYDTEGRELIRGSLHRGEGADPTRGHGRGVAVLELDL